MNPIYLDYNATTPIDPEVVDAILPFLKEHFGNPSSSHAYGQMAKKAIEQARIQIAELINCKNSEILFTSGGTESNNFAIKGTVNILKDKGNHIITSSIEHPAVEEVCRYLEFNGFEVTRLPVDTSGLISISELKNAIKPTTILITIMHANNEIGTLQPVSEIGEIARSYGIRFHTDAAQSVGKVPVNVKKTGVDLLSIAGHKLYAPKGIGVLFIKEGTQLEKFMHGANHEQNLRAGTENVPEIVGLGKAAEIAKRDLKRNIQQMESLRHLLWHKISSKIPSCKINGHPDKRLPNTLSISFPEINAQILLNQMNRIAASAGAACHSETTVISRVLEAIQLTTKQALGTIRFSTGKFLTKDDIKNAADIIIKTISLQKNKNK